mgnify:FL=1
MAILIILAAMFLSVLVGTLVGQRISSYQGEKQLAYSFPEELFNIHTNTNNSVYSIYIMDKKEFDQRKAKEYAIDLP